MTDVTKYGQFTSERLAEENGLCRQIVSEISKFGVSERQRLFIIYLLALEVEDVNLMKTLTKTVKDLTGQQLFIAAKEEDDDGSIND